MQQAETTSELLELIEGGPQVSKPAPQQSSPDQAAQVTAVDIGQYTRAMRAKIEQIALSVVKSAMLSAFQTLGDAIAPTMKKTTQANEARQRNQEARTEFLLEQTSAIRSACKGLQRVIDDPKTSPDQVLEAARLLADLARR